MCETGAERYAIDTASRAVSGAIWRQRDLAAHKLKEREAAT